MTWDELPSPIPRTVIARETSSLREIGVAFISERITGPTDWRIHEGHHTLVVHRAGAMASLECAFESGPRGSVLPAIGDVWVIPAGIRYAAMAQGAEVGFCEVAVPGRLLGDRELRPRMAFRDPFLQQAVDRVAGLGSRTDDIAVAMKDSLAELLRLHLIDIYTEGNRPRRPPRSVISTKVHSRPVQRIRDSLDARHTVAGLAQIAGLPIADFLPAFAASFGTTPHRYLVSERIRVAKERISATSTPITDIALDVGFASPAHFATSFRQHVGLSPLAYRRLVGRAG